MKHSLILVMALATIFSLGNGFANAADKHLFMLAGQSNMAQLDPNTSFTPTVANEFGQNDIIVVKEALGGAPISRWYKNWESPDGSGPAATGDLYDSLLVKVNQAIQGQTIETMTFVWMQGEHEGRTAGWGAVYAASLQGLITQLRNDLGRQDIHFVIGRLSDYDPGISLAESWAQVREAQVAVGNAHLRHAWVNTDDLNGVINDLHYTVAGYTILGQRFADTAIQLINSPDPQILTPTPSSTLTTPSVTFTGGHTSQDQQHWLHVGTAMGGKTLYDQSLGTNHTATVSGLPSSGTLFVRYWTSTSSGWAFQDHTYTMSVGGGGGTFPPAMTSPAPGSTLTSTSVTFTGGHTSADVLHALWVGTSPGSTNLHQGGITNHSQTVAGLPSSGTVYVRYWSNNSSNGGAGWAFQDHTYTMSVGGN